MSEGRLKNRDWMVHGLCRGQDPDRWFPSGAGRLGHKQAEAAAVICRQCPVIKECDQYRRETGASWGVWGGVFVHDRYATFREPIHHGTEAAYKRHLRRGEPPCGACRAGSHRQRQARKQKRRAS
jgi:WhiB family redox-sensing transcriptional regulator